MLMTNKFRTLLLNISSSGIDEDFIDQSFRPHELPQPLQSFYNLLYPTGSSREYKLLLTYYYLQMLNATQYKNIPSSYDRRITYDLTQPNFFQFYRLSVPASSDAGFNLIVNGNYVNDAQRGNFSDTIVVRQLTNTNNVKISSNNNYFAPQTVMLSFTNNLSEQVDMTDIGLSFRIDTKGNNFTGSALKKFTFYAESPIVFDFEKLFDTLIKNFGVVENMFSFDFEHQDASYYNQWSQNNNKVYRFVGALLAYVGRVQTL